MTNVISYVKLFIILLGVSCVSKPYRPDTSVCLYNSDGWVCTNASGDFRQEPNDLVCTTLPDYSVLERYVDQIELRLRKLERRCKN